MTDADACPSIRWTAFTWAPAETHRGRRGVEPTATEYVVAQPGLGADAVEHWLVRSSGGDLRGEQVAKERGTHWRPTVDIPHRDMESPDDETIVAEGLAGFASTFFAMGDPPEVVRQKLLEHWNVLGRPPGAFGDAAQAISTLPQPLHDSPFDSIPRWQYPFPDLVMSAGHRSAENRLAQI